MTKLTGQEITERTPPGWVYLRNALRTRLRTGDFATGLALVNAIGAAAEAVDHHPDLDLRYTHVDVRLYSHDVGRVTGRDLRLAATISELAAGAGVGGGADGLTVLELALDSPGFPEQLGFWEAVLGYPPDADGDLVDPYQKVPLIWFQHSGDEEPRQRWHPDLWVAPAEVAPRIEAALAAGGTLVSDAGAPSYWVLADPEGNRVCLCTWQGRE
ncbi:4a-hydroxytetrahydrobiopterin dehydratase [Actinoplanes sp. CA-252034]|uniref:4a-hydroxytetrahydrobiopterin dehydratase n=1 Tax=Actinoplanes sp. CA-252034 TaxID=3239906 RepID=UPI003D99E950